MGQMLGEPCGTSGGECSVNSSLVQREIIERSLIIEWAGVHGLD